MDFPINKLPAPKYKDKPAKHKEIKKNPLVKYIHELFNDTYKTRPTGLTQMGRIFESNY